MKLLKRFLFLTICISTVILSSCRSVENDDFGIYLLAENVSGAKLSQLDINALVLENKPLISSEDIISYEKDTHIITLTQAAYTRVQNIFPTPVRVDGIPFVVCVGDERIYAGAFWTPLSSLSYDGVVIMQPLDPEGKFIRIDLGYPSPEVFTGDDPRSDSRIIKFFEQAGKLK